MMLNIYTCILLFLCSSFVIFGFFYSKNDNSLSSYLNANRSIRSTSLTASIVASCFGVWILIGPAEAATWGGIGAITGYALGQACPYLAMSVFGKRLRNIMPKGNSLTQFVFARYGSKMLQIVLVLSLFYMFIYLCAEVTAIAKVVQLISGTDLWKTSLLILVSTLVYTLKGGLKISIITDKFQFIIICIFLIFIFYFLFFSGEINISSKLIGLKASNLIDPKYFYGYTAGITFFIAVFATNLFDQGVWQRVYAAKSNQHLESGFKNSFFIVLPVILILGFCGIIAVSLGQTKDPSTVVFAMLLGSGNQWLSIAILILALILVISSMDTLINAISSLLVIESKKLIQLKSRMSHLNFSKIILVVLSLLVFYVASKGLSVLYMFLLADLLCCAAAVPVFYGMFKNDTSGKGSVIAACSGLVAGLLLFPDLTFQKSILVGGLLDSKYFPSWISTALLFWSFLLATLIPLFMTLILRNKKHKFKFSRIKVLVNEIK